MIVVFESDSSFVISRTGSGDILDLKTGIAYFTLKTLPDGLTFGTPQADVVTEMMVLNAATGNQLLKGYVKVGKSESELGVLEGGSLMVQTADGQQSPDSASSWPKPIWAVTLLLAAVILEAYHLLPSQVLPWVVQQRRWVLQFGLHLIVMIEREVLLRHKLL
ncbi:MAG: hypothetical protein JRD04_00005 [Deltaproteobacteria bacterium]|nr:hypothetical protein [Deltaproteobacteria bacterium]